MANPTVEMSCRLPIKPFMAVGPEVGVWDATYTFRPYYDGPIKVSIRVDRLDPDRPFAVFKHRGRRNIKGGGGPQEYRVELASTPMRFGGVRWWWRCPYTGERTPFLFLPLGCLRFASRRAWRLPYATQRMSPMERARTKLRRQYRRRLGGSDDISGGVPPKPPWMRWATYDRLAEKLEPIQAEVDTDFARSVGRLLGAGFAAG